MMDETGSVKRDLTWVMDADVYKFLLQTIGAKVRQPLVDAFEPLAALGTGLCRTVHDQVQEEVDLLAPPDNQSPVLLVQESGVLEPQD